MTARGPSPLASPGGGKTVMAGTRIREIDLASARFGDALVDLLAPAVALEKLSLQATEVGDLGVQKLARFKNLKELDLAYTPVSDAALRSIAALTSLQKVSLGGTRITGGRGTVFGTLLGVFVVTIISDSLILVGISSYWERCVTGILVILGATVPLVLQRLQSVENE